VSGKNENRNWRPEIDRSTLVMGLRDSDFDFRFPDLTPAILRVSNFDFRVSFFPDTWNLTPSMLHARILVLSDASSRGERPDLSGPAVREILQVRGWQVAAIEILPDDLPTIQQKLEALTDGDDCDVVFTAGGTGVGPRDVTPEATRAIAEKEIPGLAELMRAEGVKKTRRAALSRGIVGVRKAKLIVNLPGSPKGARESLDSILDLLPHVIDLVQGRTAHHD
jgi:molybdenum cofactor synthesis domain-containing protein